MDAVIDLIPPKIAAYLPLSNAGYVYATDLAALIDVSKPSLWLSVASILFNPIYWNITARNEYRNKTLQKTLGGSLPATYFFFVTIFSLGILRDHLYQTALKEQPHWAPFAEPAVKAVAVALFVVGQIFVVTSMWALGITGTYLGDYCGILMKERVTGFPFNVLNDPMYVGSAMAFLGTALWYESPAGVVLSVLVWIVYAIALGFEGPFTDKIYTTAAAAKVTKTTPAETAKPAAATVPVTSEPTPTVAAASVAAASESIGTPRKSSRLAQRSDETLSATTTAVANGAATPRRKSRKSALVSEAAEPSPMRVTRSRSRARTSEAENSE